MSRDSITDELRADILDGRFPPGERLVEARLTAHYECGRLAVRTALVELAAEGLLNREANRGASVREVSLAEAIQITEARSVLESMIAAQAARNADEDQRLMLAAIIDDMADAVADDDLTEYSRLNGALHRVLREASGHNVAAHLVTQLRNRGAQHRFRLAAVPGRAAESLEQHRAIVAAVIKGDARAATKAMTVHLASAIAMLQSWPNT